MHEIGAETLVRTWERGRDRHPIDRSLLLYALAVPDAVPAVLADRPLGERNAALLHLHQAVFGDGLDANVACPNCAEQLGFSLSAGALCGQPVACISHVDVDGMRVRIPTTRDIALIAAEQDVPTAAQKLLASIAVPPGEREISPALFSRVAEELERADPRIDVALALNCPACAHGWTASFDVAAFVWHEVETTVQRLLDEVDAIARIYGWPEQEILRLTPARRAAYLERSLA
jgi:hypothetical protein